MADTPHGLRFERRGAALVATLDRPESKNALSTRTVQALSEFAARCSASEDIRAAIFTAAGNEVFVSGGDLREFADFEMAPVGAAEVLEMGRAMHDLERCQVPVIAAIQGLALGGGCELILACDLAIAEEHANLIFRQAAMGLSTGFGGGTRLVERVGPLNAARLLLLGERMTASAARALGLINEVVPRGESLPRALELVEQIAKLPRDAVAGLKKMLRDVRQAQRGRSHDAEAEVFASLWGGPTHRAAMEEFLSRKTQGKS